MSAAPSDQGSIAILPVLSGLGGPASFHGRLTEGLRARGWRVHHDPLAAGCRALLVIGGTRRIDLIYRAKQRGVRIVQRLNGMNWLHRKTRTGAKHYLRSEINNWILAVIRRSLADEIVYQSQFSRNWWNTVRGFTRKPARVVHNGVDLTRFTPEGSAQLPSDHLRVLMVEGHVAGGYELGLVNGIKLVHELNRYMSQPVKLHVAGDVPADLRANSGTAVTFAGAVPRDEIPALDRSAHLLFSADLNAACPNSVIEALACGLPVVAFATGSLPELIEDDAGIVVPYGSNYWNLEEPDIPALAAAAGQVLLNPARYRAAARARAEAAFSLDTMVEQYLAALTA